MTDLSPDALEVGYVEALERLSAEDRASVTSMFLRTKHVDATLDESLRAGATQVIILGAGFDSRGELAGLTAPQFPALSPTCSASRGGPAAEPSATLRTLRDSNRARFPKCVTMLDLRGVQFNSGPTARQIPSSKTL